MTEQNGQFLVVPIWAGLALLWLTSIGLMAYATWIDSHMGGQWALLCTAAAGVGTLLYGQQRCRRMMAESFRLGRESAQREMREMSSGGGEVRHLH